MDYYKKYIKYKNKYISLKQKKIIVLIIASYGKNTYDLMINLWKKYMNNNENIKSYFIMFKENINDPVVIDEKENTIWIKGKETYIPGILEKTIISIEYLLKNNFEFDYIFRTNLSSVLDLNKLIKLVNDNNYEYAGVINNKHIVSLKFVSGAGILLSKNTCIYIINNKNKLDYNKIDDVSIGKLLINYLNLQELPRLDIYKYDIDKINKDFIKDHFHFRCKTSIKHEKTSKYMEHLIKLIYNK